MEDLDVQRARAAEERRVALTEGADPAGLRRARRSLPLDVDVSRRLTTPAKLSVTREYMVRRACDCDPGCLVCACEAAGESLWTRAKPGPAGADAGPGTEFVHLSGVASVAEKPYEMWDLYGPYVERVSRDAFSDSLARQPDVAFLCNHEGMTMARTLAGTLLLSSTKDGLAADAWLNPERVDCASLVTAIKDGCIDQMSFGAMLNDGIWNEDFTEFTLTQLDLHCGDVSAVNFGANPFTSIAARSHNALASIDRMPESVARAAWRRLDKRFRTAPDSAESPPPSDSKPTSGRSLSLVRAALMAAED